MSDVTELLKEFVAHNTVTTRSNAALARRVGRLLGRAGFRVSYQKVRRNGQVFVNVLGRKGPASGRPLVLCAHLDTVPPGERSAWTRTGGDPRRARVERGVLYGLGSADDKGSMAAILEAASRTARDTFTRPFVVLGTFGEESGMGGAHTVLKRWKGPKPYAVLAAEPTALGVTYKHKGMGVAEITLVARRRAKLRAAGKRFSGRSAHSSQPSTGVNALDKAVRWLRTSGRGTLVASLDGGQARNMVPASARLAAGVSRSAAGSTVRPVFPAPAIVDVRNAVARTIARFPGRDRAFDPPVSTSTLCLARTEGTALTLCFDFRLNPGQTMDRVVKRLKKLLTAGLAVYRRELGWKLRVERDNPALRGRPLGPAGRLAAGALADAGLSARFLAKSGCTEAGLYSRWGVSSAVLGPGVSRGNIHRPNERIAIGQLEAAVRIYERIIRRACTRAPEARA